jgi:hypothetical protein
MPSHAKLKLLQFFLKTSVPRRIANKKNEVKAPNGASTIRQA